MSKQLYLTPATNSAPARVIEVESGDDEVQQYVTPATPDKAGELVTVRHARGQQQFLAPVSPWAVNEKQLGDLRSAVTAAETALRHAKSRRAGSAEIRRLDKALTSAKRELDTVEYELRRNRQREQTGGNDVFERNTANLDDLREMVASAVAGVNALVGTAPPPSQSAIVRYYAAQGKTAVEVQGMFGPAIMVR